MGSSTKASSSSSSRSRIRTNNGCQHHPHEQQQEHVHSNSTVKRMISPSSYPLPSSNIAATSGVGSDSVGDIKNNASKKPTAATKPTWLKRTTSYVSSRNSTAEEKSCCESSFSLNCSCRQIPMFGFLLILSFLFFFCNITLFVQVNTHLLDLMSPTSLMDTLTSTSSATILAVDARTKSRIRQVSTSNNNKLKLVDENMLSFAASESGMINNKQTMENGHSTNGRGIKKDLATSTSAGSSNTEIEPMAASLLPNATFSACLLIKDDNDILNEWIAYHYHTVQLRHLIVAIDPTSTESPSEILNKWRTVTSKLQELQQEHLYQQQDDGGNHSSTSSPVQATLEIVEWHDDDYMPTEFLQTGRAPVLIQSASDLTNIADVNNPELQDENVLLEISNHRYRQRVFLAQCMKEFRNTQKTWVVHIDTDEYIVASKLLRQMNPSYLTIQSTEIAGSVLNLIQQAIHHTAHLVGYPCISMLRVLFGSVESTHDEVTKDVPHEFDPMNFETMRWRYHALPHNMTFHGNPKVILDVSAIPLQYFPQNIVYSIHRPVKEVCPRNKELAFSNFRKQPIATNHYLGSWERYNSRNDKRRSRSVYDRKATVKRGKDDYTRSWLKGFVHSIGYDSASQLLGSRYIMNYTSPIITSSATTTFRSIISTDE